MALLHFAVKSVSRSTGRSAAAADAYRTGSRINDERNKCVHNYTRKQGVLSSSLIYPDTCVLMPTREQLWNCAAKAEGKRRNAIEAREYEIALPHELSKGEQQNLAAEFGKHIANKFQVAVSVAVHAPHRNGDERNIHAHILTTTRTIDKNGELGEKTRFLDVIQTSRPAVTELRAEFVDIQNKYLERAGVQERLNPKTKIQQLLDSGVAIEQAEVIGAPTKHLGVKWSNINRKEKARCEAEGLAYKPIGRVACNNQKILEKRSRWKALEYEAKTIISRITHLAKVAVATQKNSYLLQSLRRGIAKQNISRIPNQRNRERLQTQTKNRGRIR